jgi:serine/threonine protein kinase
MPRAGLPEFLDAGVTADARVYVVGPYVPGPSIADYVTSRHSNAAERVDLAMSLCTLVADLHQHGIIHGSIKPTNIIVTESRNGPCPVLLDVGFVPALSHSRGPARSPDEEASTLEEERSDVRSLLVLLTSLLWDSTTPAMSRAESAAALAALLGDR